VFIENHRYPVLKTRLVDECLHPTFGKNFSLQKKFSRRSVSIFSQQKIGRWRGCPCQALNGWTVCRFHGVRGGGAEREDEWRLPARLQDEGNDRSLEAYKITALMSAYGGKADIEWKRFHVR